MTALRFIKKMIFHLSWFYIFLYTAWNLFVPVAVDVHLKSWVVVPGSISTEVDGFKLRVCALVANSGVGYVLSGDRWTEVLFDAVPAEDGNHYGRTMMGRWTWYIPENGTVHAPSRVRAHVKYACGGEIIDFYAGPTTVGKGSPGK